MDIEKELSRLNPRQKEAVKHTEGPVLVLAGAGSGKTRVITTRIAYLLSLGVSPETILAVTFTNKAAREMKERVSALSRKNKKKGPVISTFHSLCLGILRNEIELLGYRRDFSIYDTSDQYSLLRNILSDIRFHDKSFKVELLLERISRSKNAMTQAEKGGESGDELEMISDLVYPKYLESLKSLNAVDFDDLLLLTVRLFRNNPAILDKYRERFIYIMVDEYQDTNRVQYELIKLLSGERKNLCVVGDDDQSIYGWRGADLGNILDFEKDFPGAKVVRLEQNYRSYGCILSAANGVIKNNKKRMAKSLWTRSGPGPKVKVHIAQDGEAEARWVADRISLMRMEKNLPAESFAVIYRANVFSRPFEEALRRNRIPYTVVGGTSYFEHKEIRDLAAYLKIISNPSDDLSLLRVANIPKRGLGPAAIGKLSDHAQRTGISLLDAFRNSGMVPDLGESVKKSASGFSLLVDKYREWFGRPGQMAVSLETLLDQIDYRQYIRELYKTPEVADRKTESCNEFTASLGYYEKESESPSLQGFLETLALTDMVKEKAEPGPGGVTLISFHSSKGLEFPVVFIAGAEEDIIPHKKSAGDFEEERRLFYVGITRAMKELFITRAARRTRYGKEVPSNPSRFLGEIPEDVISYVDEEQSTPLQEEKAAEAFFANIRSILKK